MQAPVGFRIVAVGSEFEARVREAVLAIPAGRVAAYGMVAAAAGRPGAARAVGAVMSRGEGLPWHRVVTAQGRLVPGHEREHAARLRAEGVRVRAGHVTDPVPWADRARTARPSRGSPR